MGRETFRCFAAWYVIFLLCSVVLLTGISACEAKTSGILDSWYDLPQEEINAGFAVADKIEIYSGHAGYTCYRYDEEDETRDNIYYVALGCGQTYSIAWYHGHGWKNLPPFFLPWLHMSPYPHWHDHWYIFTHDGEAVSDTDIYAKTSCENVRFAFLFACKPGDVIGGSYACGQKYGMPNAWLHTTDLSGNGYTNPDNDGYTFLGWYYLGPQLKNTIDDVAQAGKKFSIFFYKASLDLDGYSINEALDYAAYETFGEESFDDCVFYTDNPPYGHMVVYGDGNLEIS